MTPIEIHTTIAGGFPIIAKVYLAPPDPSVGIFNHSLDDYELFIPRRTKTGTRYRPAGQWLYNKVTESDEWRFVEKAMEEMG